MGTLGERRLRRRRDVNHDCRVLVIGAGVSGCACATALATRGVAVTAISSVLDTVGQPGYGPEVVVGAGEWRRVARRLTTLPPPLREVWIDASVAPEGGAAWFAVDRRMVSVETKRILESIPGLEFRQGRVVELEVRRAEEHEGRDTKNRGKRVRVETVFGEVIEGDAVVVAVGLGLGGTVAVGEETAAGGRWGETPSVELGASLEKLGAAYRKVTVNIGPAFPQRAFLGGKDSSARCAGLRGCPTGAESSDDRELGWSLQLKGSVPLRQILETLELCDCSGRIEESEEAAEGGQGFLGQSAAGQDWLAGGKWPAQYPPAPYWTPELRTQEFMTWTSEVGDATLLISPGGVATDEGHVLDIRRAGSCWGGTREVEATSRAGRPASRLEHRVAGLCIDNLSVKGRLRVEGEEALPVWVCGKAAGAADYLDSLVSGVLVGREVAKALGEGEGRLMTGEERSGEGGCKKGRVADGGNLPNGARRKK